MEKKRRKDEETPLPEENSVCECAQCGEENIPNPPDESAAEIETLREELAAAKDRYLRTAAEYENYRRRSAKERDNLYNDCIALSVSAMLPVLDNLERAVSQKTTDEAFMKGVEMTLTQFYVCLEKIGVKEIPALGEQFDPNVHDAVMHVELENCDDNTVVEVFQKGFVINGRVIRHAAVKVAN